MRVKVVCPICNKVFERYQCQLKGKQVCCCSVECKNEAVKRKLITWDTTKASIHLSELNRKRNPTSMTPEVRAKLRAARLGRGEGKSYSKLFGRHEHVVVAERILGRKLEPGEIVHHIDRNKRNNDPSNLVVMTQSQHAHLHAVCRNQKEVMSSAFQALSVSAER